MQNHYLKAYVVHRGNYLLHASNINSKLYITILFQLTNIQALKHLLAHNNTTFSGKIIQALKHLRLLLICTLVNCKSFYYSLLLIVTSMLIVTSIPYYQEFIMYKLLILLVELVSMSIKLYMQYKNNIITWLGFYM